MPVRVDALTTLARMAGEDHEIPLGSIVVNADGELSRIAAGARTAQFTLHDQTYRVWQHPTPDGALLHLRVLAGALPFTAESPDDRRRALLAMREIGRTGGVRFSLNGANVVAGVEISLPRPISLDSFFFEVVLFVQQTRPLLRLLQDFLHPAAVTGRWWAD